MSKDRVEYRILGGEVIALFPDITEGPNLISSYMHVFQHSAASVELLTELPLAEPEECVELVQELISIGYDVEVSDV